VEFSGQRDNQNTATPNKSQFITKDHRYKLSYVHTKSYIETIDCARYNNKISKLNSVQFKNKGKNFNSITDIFSSFTAKNHSPQYTQTIRHLNNIATTQQDLHNLIHKKRKFQNIDTHSLLEVVSELSYWYNQQST
jgi:hypothetical protein